MESFFTETARLHRCPLQFANQQGKQTAIGHGVQMVKGKMWGMQAQISQNEACAPADFWKS